MPEPSPPSRAGTRAGNAWNEARDLVWAHRGRLFLGFLLLGASRFAALALPASSKFVVDEVIVKRRAELLGPLAGLIVLAALVQGASSIALSRTLGVAAQRAITDLRRILQAQVTRLPVRFFDSTKTGVLISRIMSDPDAVRNLMGTGLVQLAGSLLTAVLALGALVYLNWRLTLATLGLLAPLAILMTRAFKLLRPLFAQRAELNAQLVGRLNATLGGIRVVKAYRGEPHEQRLFAEGADRLFASVVRELMTSAWVGALAIVNLGVLSAVLVYLGGRSIIGGAMTLGDFVMF